MLSQAGHGKYCAHLKAVRSTPAMSIEDTSKDYFIIVHNS